jgi:hypothetical protein
MSTTGEQVVTVITLTASFRDGFTQGREGFYRAIKVGNQVKEDVIVDMVRNLTEIAAEGWLSEDLLRRDAGILAGYSPIARAWFRPGSVISHFCTKVKKRGVETYGEGYITARPGFPNCRIEPFGAVGI